MQFTFFLFSRSCALPCHSNLLLKAVAATQVRPNVRFGSKADICSALAHVRFVPIADISRQLICRLATPGQPVLRAESLRGLEIDD